MTDDRLILGIVAFNFVLTIWTWWRVLDLYYGKKSSGRHRIK